MDFHMIRDSRGKFGIHVYTTDTEVGIIRSKKAVKIFEVLTIKKYRENWERYEYDVAQAINQWLNTPLMRVNPKARRTLEMIIAILNNRVIGRAAEQSTLNSICPQGTEYVDLTKLETMTGTELAKLHNTLMGGTMDRVRDKAKVAKIIKEEIDKMSEEIQKAQDKEAEKARKAAEKKAEKDRKAAERKAAKEAREAEKKAAKEAAAANRPPRTEGAVARVHAICNANKDKKRGDVVKLCVEAGINEGTAKTQYQVWHKKQEAAASAGAGTSASA